MDHVALDVVCVFYADESPTKSLLKLLFTSSVQVVQTGSRNVLPNVQYSNRIRKVVILQKHVVYFPNDKSK